MPFTRIESDYRPVNIICRDLGGAITHIGIVSNKKSTDDKRCLIDHNKGNRQVLENCLFNFKIIRLIGLNFLRNLLLFFSFGLKPF